MSFFKRLFGSKEPSDRSAKPEAEAEYDGYTIIATPMKEGGQYRLHGTITKTIDDEVKSHTLIRADLFSSKEECASFTIKKAKQVIDEQGESIMR